MLHANHSREEIARRGKDHFSREIASRLSSEDEGRFVIVDVESGDYEVDDEDLIASRRLLERRPDAVLFGLRVGSPTAYRFGVRATVK